MLKIVYYILQTLYPFALINFTPVYIKYMRLKKKKVGRNLGEYLLYMDSLCADFKGKIMLIPLIQWI